MNNIFSPKVYDWCKWICIICLPTLSNLVLGLSKIYGFETVGAQVAQTITLLATALGSLLCISHIQYKNGSEG